MKLAWQDRYGVSGTPDPVVVKAPMVETDQYTCPRKNWLEARPNLRVASAAKRYPYPFLLGKIRDITDTALKRDDLEDFETRNAWLSSQVAGLNNPLAREYVVHAVETILDVHDGHEAELGKLRQLSAVDRSYQTPSGDRRLQVWAPAYTSADGVIEIRRLRLNGASAEATPAHVRWAATAATAVLSAIPPTQAVSRIRVVEIGCGDGSTLVILDETIEALRRLYRSDAMAKVQEIVGQDHAHPSKACGSCQLALVCDELVPLDGVLRATSSGAGLRSVSVSDLQSYETCPAQWLGKQELHLPREDSIGEAAQRGINVHRWLEWAHGRGRACSAADLPEDVDASEFPEKRTQNEYQQARALLLHHIDNCAVTGAPGEELIVEETIRGLDHLAGAVVAAKPDMIVRRGSHLAVREFKTGQGLPEDEDAAFSQNLQIPFMIVMLNAGLMEHLGVTSAQVELEALAPSGSRVFTWDAADAETVRYAEQEVRRATAGWHTDRTWAPKPNGLCPSCPVRRWCPERDTWSSRDATRAFEDRLPSGLQIEAADLSIPL